MTIQEALKKAEQILLDNNKETSVAKILLMHVLNMESHEILLHFKDEILTDYWNLLNEGINKYMNGYPVQYITNEEYFYGYQFYVDERVLIPRFETEELVSLVLETSDDVFEHKTSIDLVDIGTGSGAIAITLGKEEPKFNVTATDLSKDALAVANLNANKIGVDVNFLQGDMTKPLKGRTFDIVVSNPPYIPLDEDVDSLVKDNEPHMALFGGSDGLIFYKTIIDDLKNLLRPVGFAAFEIGHDQASRLEDYILSVYPKSRITVKQDLQRKDRMLIVRNIH